VDYRVGRRQCQLIQIVFLRLREGTIDGLIKFQHPAPLPSACDVAHEAQNAVHWIDCYFANGPMTYLEGKWRYPCPHLNPRNERGPLA
jgi:hypothetical protein